MRECGVCIYCTRYGVVENCGCPTGDKVHALFPATTGLLKQRTRQSRNKKRWVGSDASNWNADACQVIPPSSYRTWIGLDPNREDTLDWKLVSLWCVQVENLIAAIASCIIGKFLVYRRHAEGITDDPHVSPSNVLLYPMDKWGQCICISNSR